MRDLLGLTNNVNTLITKAWLKKKNCYFSLYRTFVEVFSSLHSFIQMGAICHYLPVPHSQATQNK
jgi:hypothetical protein